MAANPHQSLYVCLSGLEYLQSLNLERVVMCQLNPLKVCLPSVTSMFAAITRYTPCPFSVIGSSRPC